MMPGMNRRNFLAAISAVAVLPRTAGAAASPVSTVELFTSQGCSSCPPADALLETLSTRPDLLALSYHVDYWDYLGWKDTLGSTENTQRQYAYARSFKSRSVYTPQAVINGAVHVNGASRAEIDAALAANALPQSARVTIAAQYSNDRIIIETSPASGEAAHAHVLIAWFEPMADVVITRGENRGETLRYVNAVKALRTIGMAGSGPMRFEIPETEFANAGAHGCAILVQAMSEDGAPGTIYGAARLSARTG